MRRALRVAVVVGLLATAMPAAAEQRLAFIGVALDRPTIGVAKSLLFGRVRGDKVVDEEGKQIAEPVTLPGRGKTIYVSVGHKVSLDDAVKIVKQCLTARGPAPVSMAHDEVTRKKWQLKKSNPASS